MGREDSSTSSPPGAAPGDLPAVGPLSDDRWTSAFSSGYDDLRLTAHRLCRAEPRGGTLSPTALLHEVFLRLSRASLPLQDSRHLTALCIRIMRQILVDQARHRMVRRRRQGASQVLPERVAAREPSPEDVLALDEALGRLRALDARKADVFALRFYCSLTLDEVAANLGIARSTASDDWKFARAWLASQLRGGEP